MTSFVAAGSVQLGLGDDSTPITDDQPVALVCGTQGGTMFLLNARVHGLDVTDQIGAVNFTATGAGGVPLTAASAGCRMREFEKAGDGSMQLTSPYGLPLDQNALEQYPLEGSHIAITVEVHDRIGNRASDTRTVVAHLPGPCGG